MDRNDAGSVPKTEARAEARAPVPGTHTAATTLEPMRLGDRSIVDAGQSAVAASSASASAIARDPVGSLCALGIVAQRTQPHQLALAQIGRAMVLDPGRAQPHFALGCVLHQAGRLADATARYARAIELDPMHAEAHMNLCIVLERQGRLDAAAAAFQHTLRLRPAYAEALHNLAAVHLARGDPVRALGAARRALEMKEMPSTRGLFARLIRDLASAPFIYELRGLVTRAIAEAWDRPRVIAPVATTIIKQDARLAPLIARAVAALPARLPFDEVITAAGLAAISADTLLVALLESTHVCDRELERFLTVVRGALLAAAEDRHTSADLEKAGAMRFCCALAAQCWINEYVFDVTDDELARVTALTERVVSALRADEAVPILPLVVVASYRPLLSVIAPEMLDRPWPEPVAGIVKQQVHEPLEERQLAASMPRLTEIDDEVSRRVREQYEENPYPRWVKAQPPREPATLEQWLRRTLPSAATLAPLSARNGIDILVAGCGSGQNPIAAARTFAGARVLAVDLSLASLAHAQRKTRELAIDTIDYAQADILKIGSIGRQFDFVEASGVLHHLGDWRAGWRALVEVTRPGGVMRLGLYSEHASASVIAARAFIAARHYGSTPQEIRRCRQDLLAAGDPLLAQVAEYQDFFSTSECRDLLFHVQEHRLAPPQIKAFLTAHDLRFLGFVVDDAVIASYRQRFPEDPDATDLDRWDTFEAEHPAMFVRMYHFWVQKAGPGTSR
jgi:SAM-dependent methyltransferase/tetratricopeptide (TPR) repeat protein